MLYQTPYNFTFEYNDTLLNERIGNLDPAYYNWYKIDDTGAPIGLVSSNFDLFKTIDNYYILDFNTSERSVGRYKIFVYFQKDNYEPRNVTIVLTISNSVNSIDDESDDKKEENDDQFDMFIMILIIGIISIASLIGIYSLKKGILKMGIKSIRNKLLKTKR